VQVKVQVQVQDTRKLIGVIQTCNSVIL